MNTTEKGERAITWIAELLTGTYKQTKEELGGPKKGFCCLGVANYVCSLRETDTGSLSNTYDLIGLLDEGGNPASWGVYSSLVGWNDDEDLTLQQIGEILANDPHLYFTEDVADYIEAHLEDELMDYIEEGLIQYA